MSTVSLDLRGVASTHALPDEATARGAGVSLLFHGIGIGALVLVPLVSSPALPEPAASFKGLLIKPISVILPPAPLPAGRPPQGPSRPRQAQAPAVVLDVPSRVPTALSMVHSLDVEPGPISDSNDPEGPTGNSGSGGDCPLGSLCGPALPVSLAPTPPVRIGGVIREPRLIESRAPQYPPVAQAAGVAGKVVLDAHIGVDGRVLEVRILQSHTLFEQAALASVRSRRYEPLLLNGVPTDFIITITVAFNLRR